jgi:O-antigen/teichoic acid export membrane protein
MSVAEGPAPGTQHDAVTPTRGPEEAAATGRHTVQAERDAGRRGLAANLSALAASQAITWSLTLLWTLVVPRMIGPDGMGIIVTATSATAILGMVLGLPTRDFLTREIAARPDATPSLVGAAVIFRACMAPLVCVAVAIYARFADLSPVGNTVLYLTTAATLFYMLAEPALATFQGFERMQYLAYYDVLNKVFVSFGGIALALLCMRVFDLTALDIVVGLTILGMMVAGGSLAIAAVWARRMVTIDLRPGLRRITSVIRGSVPYWAFGVFFMVYLWIDAVILGLLVPPVIVGYYGVATKLFTTMMFVPFVVATASLPRFAAAFEESWQRLGAVARAPLEVVALLSLPICVFVVFTASNAIPALYGTSFAGAEPVMIVLALCVPPMYLNVMLNQVLIAAKRPMVWTYLMIGATVVNPVLNLVLIPIAQKWPGLINGAAGAAASLLVTELLIVAAGIAIVGRHVLTVSMIWRFLRSFLAAVAMAGAMKSVHRQDFLVQAVVGLATFLSCAVLLRVLSAEQRLLLRSLATQVLDRVRRRGAGAQA